MEIKSVVIKQQSKGKETVYELIITASLSLQETSAFTIHGIVGVAETLKSAIKKEELDTPIEE